MAVTRDHIITSIHKDVDISKAQSTQLLECILETIEKALEKGEDVLISGFGKFCVKEKCQRRGRNPHTGEDMMLDSRRVLVFRCSPVLKNKINGKQ